jgi:hypothetical protein
MAAVARCSGASQCCGHHRSWSARRRGADDGTRPSLRTWGQKILGRLEELPSLPVADRHRVNVNESERERNGIIFRLFGGVRRVAAIFRGAPLTGRAPGRFVPDGIAITTRID